MCGGMPLFTASVTKIRRKSCGTNRSGCPSAPVSPVAASASSSRVRMRGALIARFSVPTRRWNRIGSGGLKTRSW